MTAPARAHARRLLAARFFAAAITAALIALWLSSTAAAAELVVRAQHATEASPPAVKVRTRGLDDNERSLVVEYREPGRKCGAKPRDPKENANGTFYDDWDEEDDYGNGVEVDFSDYGTPPPQARNHRVLACVWVVAVTDTEEIWEDPTDQVVLGPVGRTVDLLDPAARHKLATADDKWVTAPADEPWSGAHAAVQLLLVVAAFSCLMAVGKTERRRTLLLAAFLGAAAVAVVVSSASIAVFGVLPAAVIAAAVLWVPLRSAPPAS